MRFKRDVIDALIFDFDGLIVDTESTDFQAWQEIYDEHGHALNLETWAACIGMAPDQNVFNPYDDLETRLGRTIDRTEVRLRRRARYTELLASRPILPGVEAAIADARAMNIRLAVASSSPRSWVTGHLTRLGL